MAYIGLHTLDVFFIVVILLGFSHSNSPVLVVQSYMSCPCSPGIFLLSKCPGYPFLDIRFLLSCSLLFCFCAPVLAIIFWLSILNCPVSVVSFRLSFSGCLFWLSCSGHPGNGFIHTYITLCSVLLVTAWIPKWT